MKKLKNNLTTNYEIKHLGKSKANRAEKSQKAKIFILYKMNMKLTKNSV